MDQEPLLFIIILIFQTFNIKCNHKWAWLSIHCICNLQLLHLNLDLTIWFTISDNKIFVLLKFIDRLLSNHLFNLLFADVINFRNYCKSSLVQKTKQTNKKHKKQKNKKHLCQPQITHILIMLMFDSMKRIGPNTDPWGTPQASSKHDNTYSPIFTICCHPESFTASLSINLSWLIVSNAFLRSIKNPAAF